MTKRKVATGKLPGEKPCTKCGETKPLTEFRKNGRGGLRADCKECQRRHYQEHRAAKIARAAAYYQEHREEKKAYSAAYQRKHRPLLNGRRAAYHRQHREDERARDRLRHLVTKDARRGLLLINQANVRIRRRAKKYGISVRDDQFLGTEWETLILWHYWFGEFADTFAISRGDLYPKATTKRERRNRRAELSRMDHSKIGYTGPDNFRVEPRFLNERRFSRIDGTVHPTTVQIMLQGVAPCGEPLHLSDLTDEMRAQVAAKMLPFQLRAAVEWDAVMREKERTGSYPRDADAWLKAYRENAETKAVEIAERAAAVRDEIVHAIAARALAA